MVHTARHWLLGFLPGAILLAFGSLNLFNKTAWLGPLSGLGGTVLSYILAFAGLFVIIDSFFEFSFHSGIGITTLITGLVVFGLGLINVLNSFGALAFKVPLADVIYHLLFMVEGILLIIATFIMD